MLQPSKLTLSILLGGLFTLSTISAANVKAQDAKRVVYDKGAFFGTSTPAPPVRTRHRESLLGYGALTATI